MLYSLKYTDRMPNEWCGGYARMWFIRIRPKYKDDIGLLEHEKVHVRQFWRMCGFHGLLYWFKWYRLKSEVEAYRIQLKYNNKALGKFAIRLAGNYNLGITVEEATKLLS